jgi:riboflavin kinase / FMN adenylyltransferase
VKVYTDLSNFKALNPVVTIGTFDGVHHGHLEVIRQLQAEAENVGGESCIFTFFPHPRLVLNPEINLNLLNTNDEKVKLLEQSGIQNLVIFPFTRSFSQLTAKEFIAEILVEKMNARTLIVGYDHHFGHDRISDLQKLQEYAQPYGIEVKRLQAYSLHNLNVSSTKVRHALEVGKLPLANALLGYPFFIRGRVVLGNQIGRTIEFPTANIEPEKHKLVPGNGVYAVWTLVGGKKYMGMLNIGFRPTIDNTRKIRTIEVHILDFNEDIYDSEIEVQFIVKTRDERRFPGIAELKAQLAEDKLEVRSILETGKAYEPDFDIF